MEISPEASTSNLKFVCDAGNPDRAFTALMSLALTRLHTVNVAGVDRMRAAARTVVAALHDVQRLTDLMRFGRVWRGMMARGIDWTGE